MQYYHVMNRQLAKTDFTQAQQRWSQVYAQSKIGGKEVHSVIISSTVSVYNTTYKNDATQKKLLGVVGTDLPVSKLSRVFRPYELGPNGYAFLVTENGFVSIHPEHRMRYNGQLRKNYRTTEITSVEYLRDVDIKRLRAKLTQANKMPDSPEATISMDKATRILPIDCNQSNCKRFIKSEVSYTFKKVKGSQFIVGVAIPEMYRNSNITFVDSLRYAKVWGQECFFNSSGSGFFYPM